MVTTSAVESLNAGKEHKKAPTEAGANSFAEISSTIVDIALY